MHEVALEELLNESSGHGVHFMALAGVLMVPGIHMSHVVRPTLDVSWYMGQSWHIDMSYASVNLPIGHCLHGLSSDDLLLLYVPGAHFTTHTLFVVAVHGLVSY